MKKYEYLLFDWDGCLGMTLDVHLESYKKTFAEFDIYPTDREITQEVFGDWNGPKKLGIIDIDTFTEKYLKRIHDAYPTVKLYDGVIETLQTLKNKGKKMALLTTSLEDTFQPALEKHNPNRMFEFILSANDVTNHKPDPEIINKALELLNGNKEESIMIGDSKSDLGAAKNAGIDSLLYFPEHNSLFYDLDTLKTYHPTFIVTDFKCILNRLL